MYNNDEMFFILGINQKKEELDFNQLITCDICGSYGRYSVFVTYTVLTVFFLPLFKWNRHYYVVSSCCNSTYELDGSKGELILNGQPCEIDKEDLILISEGRKNIYKKCRYCGYETNEDFAYCPKCGNTMD